MIADLMISVNEIVYLRKAFMTTRTDIPASSLMNDIVISRTALMLYYPDSIVMNH